MVGEAAGLIFVDGFDPASFLLVAAGGRSASGLG